MKRLSILFTSLILLVCVLSFSAFASSPPNGAIQPEDGTLYNKILYWQDYVLNSTQNSSGTWTTRIGLPKASIWELNDAGGAYGQKWYTENTSSRYFQLDDRDMFLEWSNAFYISLEDINYTDFHSFSFIAQSSFNMTSVDVQLVFYDAYLNSVSHVTLGGGGVDPTTVIGDTLSFQFGESNYSLGAKYFRFFVNIGYQSVEPETNQWFNFNWSIDLPYQYDDTRFAVDGIDAWMNGYFKPIVPSDVAEQDIWNQFTANINLFTEFIEGVKSTFAYYRQGFLFWSDALLRFYSIGWIGQIINASIAIGAIAFFFGIAVEGAGRLGKSAKGGKNKSNRSSPKNDKKGE